GVERVRVTVERMVVGGDGLGREADGRVVFVRGAIVGETVDVEVVERRRDFARAEVSRVVEPSPWRVEPPCAAWHNGCGGCDWQHVDSAAQLGLKVDIVREALARTAHLPDAEVVAAGSVASWGYRTTVRLAGRADGRVGFRGRRSRGVIAIDECMVAADPINAALAAGRIDGRRALRRDVLARVGTDDDRVALHAIDAQRDQPSLRATSHVTRGRGRGGVVVNEVAGARLRVSADSFFQSSAAAAELLVAAVERCCADLDLATATVVDAYGGVGLFGATVGRDAPRLIVVESSPSSSADARLNLGDRAGVQIVQSTVERWTPQPADLVIADPARSGLGREAAAVLAATQTPRLVLVSCDVGSLTRDVRLLTDLGYEHRGTQVLDLFPNTSHVEAVTRFDRA
ncbi:MAG TPA: TRAM domain-containing protein, partial [Ilumatobacteraceae bacterium]|nr:TRAM domain-containing protein [Ilumatobacteraceae bacterium]